MSLWFWSSSCMSACGARTRSPRLWQECRFGGAPQGSKSVGAMANAVPGRLAPQGSKGVQWPSHPSLREQEGEKKRCTGARRSLRGGGRGRRAHTSGTGLPVLQGSRVGSRSGPLRRITAARVPRWRRPWAGSCCRSSSLTAASVRARSPPPRSARPRLH